MTDSKEKILVTMTREEAERLITILNSIFRRDSDVEHFCQVFQKAIHHYEPSGIETPS